jgi:hypothetical protein
MKSQNVSGKNREIYFTSSDSAHGMTTTAGVADTTATLASSCVCVCVCVCACVRATATLASS